MAESHRFFAPEVVQTSGMDCGPASLKCLLEGFGIPVSYGRLREACQTEVDGTSIDTMEAVANQLGLQAEQVLIPVDHLFLSPDKNFPSIIVVRLPSGLTHFVIAWRAHAGVLQVMDPATGRRWPSVARFLKEIYVHTMPVPSKAWREFARGDDFQAALKLRMRALGMGRADADRLAKQAREAPAWRAMAALDAAVRLLDAVTRSGGLKRGSGVARVLERFCGEHRLIPERYWSALTGPRSEDGEEQVLMRGAVLVRAVGKWAAAEANLGPELAAALNDPPSRPGRELCRVMFESGILAPAVLIPALALAAGGAIVEAVLFRGLFDLARELALPGQRIAAIAAIVLFSAALLLLEIPIFASVLRLGRQLENRLRMAFLGKIPRLADRYFQSRLTSDMAERSHTTQRLRHVPDLGRQLLRSILELCATAAGIAWLDPAALPIVILSVAAAILPALLTQPVLAERDLRVRSHAAALTRYYLDALLGLIAIRAHGAERSVRRQHESLLTEWAGAAFGLQRAVIGVEAFQAVTMFGLAAWLLLMHLSNNGDAGRALLMAYWAMNLPAIGQEIGVLARQYPYYRNLTLRLLEPLGAPEQEAPPVTETAVTAIRAPHIAFRKVSVEAGGHIILEDIDFEIESGVHLGIVGPSGAGKSSLVGILLGWLKAKSGEVLIDGRPLNSELLRQGTAWVDPAVQLWNRSLFDNLSYGMEGESFPAGKAIDTAMLRGVLASLPEGLQTSLGEGGGLLSGGEGQRVRLGRAVSRRDTRLVILDEPFRGLDRQRRRELLARARDYWRACTLLCITHDVDETRAFDRVLVMERGRIVEDGTPGELAKSRHSRYSQLLDAEVDVRTGMWSSSEWRRVQVVSGEIFEDESRAPDREVRPMERG